MIGKWKLEKLDINKLIQEYHDAIERRNLAQIHALAIENELNSRGYYFTPQVPKHPILFDKCTCLEKLGDDMTCSHHKAGVK